MQLNPAIYTGTRPRAGSSSTGTSVSGASTAYPGTPMSASTPGSIYSSFAASPAATPGSAPSAVGGGATPRDWPTPGPTPPSVSAAIAGGGDGAQLAQQQHFPQHSQQQQQQLPPRPSHSGSSTPGQHTPAAVSPPQHHAAARPRSSSWDDVRSAAAAAVAGGGGGEGGMGGGGVPNPQRRGSTSSAASSCSTTPRGSVDIPLHKREMHRGKVCLVMDYVSASGERGLPQKQQQPQQQRASQSLSPTVLTLQDIKAARNSRYRMSGSIPTFHRPYEPNTPPIEPKIDPLVLLSDVQLEHHAAALTGPQQHWADHILISRERIQAAVKGGG